MAHSSYNRLETNRTGRHIPMVRNVQSLVSRVCRDTAVQVPQSLILQLQITTY